jgi:hypothetical protein
MNLKKKNATQLIAISEELELIFNLYDSIWADGGGDILSQEQLDSLEDLEINVLDELNSREMRALKKRCKSEKPTYRAGYYAGRGYHDAPPWRRTKEFHFKVTEFVAKMQGDELWRAAKADLTKKWTTKTRPHPSVDEIWMID